MAVKEFLLRHRFFTILVVLGSLCPMVSCKKESLTSFKDAVFQELSVQTPEVTQFLGIRTHYMVNMIPWVMVFLET
jgi:hypothetical protein